MHPHESKFHCGNGEDGKHCQLCRTGGPRYDWGSACCLARFVAGQPNQGHRRMWLDRIGAQKGCDVAAEVERDARKIYDSAQKKQKQRRRRPKSGG